MIKIIKIISVISIVSLLSSCQKNDDKLGIWILDESLDAKSELLSKALSKPRDIVWFENGNAADNCNAYLSQKINSDVLAVTSERETEFQYQDCAALGTLQEANVLKTPIFVKHNEQAALAKDLCNKLDLSTFEHSLRPRMTATGLNAIQTLGIPPDRAGKNCLFVTAERRFELKPVIQFVDEKTSQHYLIVWLNDEILSGSYRDYQSLIVKMNSESMWNAVSAKANKSSGNI